MNLKPLVKIITVLIAVTSIATATSCGGQGRQSEKLSVTVTIAPYADFVRQIGGDKVEVTVMVPPGASPHTYEPTPGQMVSLSQAEVYVQVGSGIEFELTWMDNLIAQNPDMLVVNASSGIDLIASTDPDEPGMDPHVWTSPINAKIIVQDILNGLIAVDPTDEDFYRSNAESYMEQLDELDAYIHSKLDGYSNRYFLTYHPSFGYFSKEYDINQLSIEFEGKDPTPQGLQECIDLAKQHDLNYVFTEPQFVLEYAETIADAIGGETVTVDALSEHYCTSMRNLADALTLEME